MDISVLRYMRLAKKNDGAWPLFVCVAGEETAAHKCKKEKGERGKKASLLYFYFLFSLVTSFPKFYFAFHNFRRRPSLSLNLWLASQLPSPFRLLCGSIYTVGLQCYLKRFRSRKGESAPKGAGKRQRNHLQRHSSGVSTLPKAVLTASKTRKTCGAGLSSGFTVRQPQKG